MNLDKEIRESLKALRKDNSSVGAVPPSTIAFLSSKLDATLDPQDQEVILFHLAGEFSRAGMLREQAETLERRARIVPDDVNAWLLLADCQSSIPDQHDAAKSQVASAIAMARARNELVQCALGVQARIARRLGDRVLFEQALRELIADRGNTREVDIGFQRDIVEGLHSDFCSLGLVASYLAGR
jgi:hypothetical protein